jgi:uncharacterized membrane protein
MSSVPPPPPSNVPPPSPEGSGEGPLDVGTAVGYGWKKFTENAGPLILIALIIAAANIIGFVLRFAVDSFFLGLILVVTLYIIGQILTIGIINASLMVTRGESPEIAKAFNTEHLGPFIVGSILYGIIVFIGIILCVIPGIIAAIMLAFYGFYVLDQGMSGTDALTASFNMVRENFGRVFLVLLVAFLINALGAAICGIGLLITAPLCWIIVAYTYRKLNNQPIAP